MQKEFPPASKIDYRGDEFDTLERYACYIWYGLCVRASHAPLIIILRHVQIYKTRKEKEINVMIQQVLNMSKGNFNRETGLSKNPFKAKIDDLSVCFRRDLDIKSQFPQQRCPEREGVLEGKDIRDT